MTDPGVTPGASPAGTSADAPVADVPAIDPQKADVRSSEPMLSRAASSDAEQMHRPRRTSPTREVLRYVGLGLSVAVLLLVVLLAAAAIVVPRLAGAVPLTVLTSSMEPSLPPGTLIVVQPVDPAELVIGDVVTYQIRSGASAVITHRIIGITSATATGRSFELKGDNNGAPDADPVVDAQIQGRLWYAVPLIGFVSSAVNGESRAWIVPIAAGLLLVYAPFMIVSGLLSARRTRAGRPPVPEGGTGPTRLSKK